MAEYIDRVPFAGLIEHLNKKEPCKNCYHRAACDAWVRNATTLYDDYSYSVENCPYYIPTADVVEVVRCKDCVWRIEIPNGTEFKGIKPRYCGLKQELTGENDYCSKGAKMDGKGEGE